MRLPNKQIINRITRPNHSRRRDRETDVIEKINDLDSNDDSIEPEEEMVTTNKIKLSFEDEKKLQKMPSFTLKAPSTDKRVFSEYKPLILRNIPFFFWMWGLIFIITGIILTINVIIGDNKDKRIMDGFYGAHFWEYIVLIAIYIIGVSFFVVARYETIEVDKEKGEMRISKFYILKCKKKYLNIPIDEINSVFPTQVVTEHSQTTKTCLNKIGIQFNETNTVYIFKTVFKCLLIRDVIKLRMHLFKKISTYESVEMELKGTETHMDIIK